MLDISEEMEQVKNIKLCDWLLLFWFGSSLGDTCGDELVGLGGGTGLDRPNQLGDVEELAFLELGVVLSLLLVFLCALSLVKAKCAAPIRILVR